MEVPSFVQLALQKFSSFSGLEVSIQKSSLFHSGISADTLVDILHFFGCAEGTLPVRYLGVPLISTRLSYSDCLPLLAKVTKRVKSLKARFLTYAGRLLLIKVVLCSMVYLWFSFFVLPNKRAQHRFQKIIVDWP